VTARTPANICSELSDQCGGSKMSVRYNGKTLRPHSPLVSVGVKSGDIVDIITKGGISNADVSSMRVGKNMEDMGAGRKQAKNVKINAKPGRSVADIDPADVKRALESMKGTNPSDMMRMLAENEEVERLLSDTKQMEFSRQAMLKNIDQYEKYMPGFKQQALNIASDPVKWKLAMQSLREQIRSLKTEKPSASDPSHKGAGTKRHKSNGIMQEDVSEYSDAEMSEDENSEDESDNYELDDELDGGSDDSFSEDDYGVENSEEEYYSEEEDEISGEGIDYEDEVSGEGADDDEISDEDVDDDDYSHDLDEEYSDDSIDELSDMSE